MTTSTTLSSNATPVSVDSPTLAGHWTADPVHSSFGFAVRYQGISLYKGTFGDVQATLDNTDSAYVLQGTAQAESISIVSPQAFRDHVLSADFFDAATYPQLSFDSESVTLENGQAKVVGTLTIKGVSKQVVATGSYEDAAQDAFGNVRGALRLETTIDRTEYGIMWNAPLPSGGDALAKEVTLIIELALVQTPQEAR